MFEIRPYKESDAQTVCSWITDETVFYLWSAGRCGEYPLTPEKLNAFLADGKQHDDIQALMFFDDETPVGYFTVRFPEQTCEEARLGFIIVDADKRGKGYGKEMVTAALRYAFDCFKATTVTIGVFERNSAARHCYESCGFSESSVRKPEVYTLKCGKWKCLELEAKK